MEKENARQSVAVQPCEIELLSLGDLHNPNEKEDKNRDNRKDSYETLFFADGTENKIRLLFGNKIEFCERPFEVSFALQTTRTNGEF